jgi:hypothetical protein
MREKGKGRMKNLYRNGLKIKLKKGDKTKGCKHKRLKRKRNINCKNA